MKQKKMELLYLLQKSVDKYYEEVQKNGGNRFDTSSLMTLVDK